MVRKILIKRLIHTLKMTVFWDVASCSLVESQVAMVETVCLSKTSVNF
jgi:hypothetical protein